MQQKGRVPWGYIVPAIVILGVIIGLVYYETTGAATTSTIALPPAGSHDYQTVLGLNFACLSSESYFLHIHPWLTITINGKNVTLPAGIGLTDPLEVATYDGEPVYSGQSNGNTCFEPMHTHDDSGIIHIESATDTNYTLGEFFTDWSLTYSYALFNDSQRPIVFNNTDILGYQLNSSSDSLKLLVDGAAPPGSDFNGTSSNWGNLILNKLDYCTATNGSHPPCQETADGDPEWDGVVGLQNSTNPNGYPYGGGHTIVIEYTS